MKYNIKDIEKASKIVWIKYKVLGIAYDRDRNMWLERLNISKWKEELYKLMWLCTDEVFDEFNNILPELSYEEFKKLTYQYDSKYFFHKP